jgi:CRISPR-associated protein Cas2
MYVLVTYDVASIDGASRRRLRRVAKICKNFGVRVQNSVFELSVAPDKWVECRSQLLREIKDDEDSLRFYFLGNNWRRRVEHAGRAPFPDVEGLLII